MAANDIKVLKENAQGTFDETVLTPSGIGAQSLFSSAGQVLDSDVTLTSGRAVKWQFENYDGVTYNITLPTSGNQAGDIIVVTTGTLQGPQTIRRANWVGSGGGPEFTTLVTLSFGQSYRFINTVGATQGWAIDPVYTHEHAASAITSGTLDIARIPTGTGSTQVALGNHSHELTALAATGATNGHVLTANGSGGVTFAAAAGGTPADNSITNAKLSQVSTATIKGRATAGTGNVEDLTATQARGLLALATTDNVTFGSLQGTPIGSTTRSSGAFTSLSSSQGTITASSPVTIAATWNNGNAAFTALDFSIANTDSLSSSTFITFRAGASGLTTMGQITRAGAAYFGQGTVSIGDGTNSIVLYNAGTLSFSSAGGVTANASTGDTILRRDAANTLAMYNTTNAQAFRLYNTFTDVTNNFERGFIRWSSNLFQIGTEKGATTGSRRALEFVTDNTARWRVGDGSVSSAPSMLALGNVGVFGTNESYNVVIATGSQGTVNAGVFSPNNANTGYLAIGESLHLGLTSSGTSGDVRLVRDAANVLALRNGANTPQAYRIYNTFASTTSFERANFRWASNEFIIDAEAGSGGGTLRGIKLGSATSSLLGFYGATPAAQPAAVADATDAASTQARLNDLLARLRTIGIIAT